MEQTKQIHGKINIKGPSKKKREELLHLNRNNLRVVSHLLIGHCILKGHLQITEVNCGECEVMYVRRDAFFGISKPNPQDYLNQVAKDLY